MSDAEQIRAAAQRMAEREHRAQRNYHANLARPVYWRWLESGGIRGTQPLPNPVRQHLQRYGAGALEDLAP